MKILKLRLKNVVQIVRGLGLYEFELDFSKTNNIFNILGGTNGSGKTSILNALSPFADEVILADLKGEKELIISHKGNTYKIRHYYEPNKNGKHSVHSYISKKDKYTNETVELNPNGNVGDFKNTVEQELGINPYIMKLIKLGNDMTGVIKMTPVERKKYMSVFTADVDLYLARYKKVNADCTFLNKTLNGYKDKLKMLGDEESLTITLNQLEKDINEYVKTTNSLHNKFYMNEEKIKENKKLFNEDEYNRLRKEIENATNINIDEYREKYSDIIDKSMAEIISRKKELDILNNGMRNNMGSLNNTKNILQEDVDDLNKQLEDLTIDRDRCDCNYDLQEIDKLISEKKSIIDNISIRIKPEYSKYNIDTILNIDKMFNNIGDELDAIYPQLSISEITNEDLDQSLIQKKLLKLKSEQTDLNLMKNKAEYEIKNFNQDVRDILKNENCKNCPLVKKHIEFSECNTVEQFEILLNGINMRLDRTNKMIEETYELSKIARIYTRIQDFISNIDKELLKLLSINSDTIKNKIKSSYSMLIDKYIVQSAIDNINLINDFNSEKEYLDTLYSQRDKAITLDIISTKIENVMDRLVDKNKNLISIGQSILKLKKDIENNTEEIKALEQISVYKSAKDKYESNKEELNRLDNYKNIINECEYNNDKITKEINNLNSERIIYEKKRDKIIYIINQIHEIRDSIEKYQDLYMEMKMVRDALSIKEGIPLRYVQRFLADTREIANEFIERTFNDNIRLGEFIINDKEFKMPLEGHGQDNEDISTASSGERAIISLALSLALMKQSKTKFKILYLDELDGPLDAEKRRLFLHLLDEQVKEMKIKQVFVITHNNAFSDQPANLILLKDNDIEVNEDIQTVIFRY